mmetsp:Transcript_120419/g.239658  ORF Transcript_120419/g.239658 Transcript_120419/m.239658 type:complete len:96 (-) Transcript_120419:68-355(-)
MPTVTMVSSTTCWAYSRTLPSTSSVWSYLQCLVRRLAAIEEKEKSSDEGKVPLCCLQKRRTAPWSEGRGRMAGESCLEENCGWITTQTQDCLTES